MNKVYLGIIVIFACAVVGFAQKDRYKKAPLAEPNEDRFVLMSGTQVDAQLQSTLDVNKARVGDEVVFRTRESIRGASGVVVPKGTALIGRITEVQRRTKENSQSRIGMIFDRLQGKDLSAPFSASIVSISNVAARATAGDSLMSDVSGSSQASGGVSHRSSGGGGGGLLGGVGNTVGGLVNTTTQTAGAVTNTVSQTGGMVTDTVGRTVNGIQISSSASASANSSTTLSSSDKNLRIDKGATFNLLVNNR
jgi:hypothetical protein